MSKSCLKAGLLAVAVACACGQPHTVSPTPLFAGKAAQDMSLFLPAACPSEDKQAGHLSIAMGCEGSRCFRYILSPGRYKGTREDAHGIYFLAEDKVRKPVVGRHPAEELLSGGVYLRKDGKEGPTGYVVTPSGEMTEFTLSHCEYSIEGCESCELSSAAPPKQRDFAGAQLSSR